MDDWIIANIYVLVKTYPVLSKKYESLICTAGIWEKNENYQLIRMYPVSFDFYKSQYGKLKKFTKIQVEIKRAKEKLNRPDSYKVRFDRFKVLDDELTNTRKKEVWQKRNYLVKQVSYKSLELLDDLKEQEGRSLGVIKPQKVIDFTRTKKENSAKWEQDLLNGNQEILEKYISGRSYLEVRPIEYIPWIFRYHFKCNDLRCKGHNIMCEDWELLQLWRNLKIDADKKGIILSDDKRFEKLRNKFFDYFLNKRDLNFIMGTESYYNNWLIIGVYYPPKDIPLDI